MLSSSSSSSSLSISLLGTSLSTSTPTLASLTRPASSSTLTSSLSSNNIHSTARLRPHLSPTCYAKQGAIRDKERSNNTISERILIFLIVFVFVWILAIVLFYFRRTSRAAFNGPTANKNQSYGYANDLIWLEESDDHYDGRFELKAPRRTHHLQRQASDLLLQPIAVAPLPSSLDLRKQFSALQSILSVVSSKSEPSTPLSNSAAVVDLWDSLPNAAVLILTFNRPTYLRRSIDAVLAADGSHYFDIYVSQDGSNPDLKDIRQSYKTINFWTHERKALREASQGGTAYLAQHYKWAFDRLIVELNYSHVIIIEDDMIISPDFFHLMRDGGWLMKADSSIWCISSWNDNGRKGLVYDPYRLFRTQYFPGLGWMLAAHIWQEIRDEFPLDQWDHFMRLDTISKGRSCIVPEIPRNQNIGSQGTNMGNNFFDKYLAPIAHQDVGITSFFRPGEAFLDHLVLNNYNEDLRQQLLHAHVLGNIEDANVVEELTSLRDRSPNRTLSSRIKRVIVTYHPEQYHHIEKVFSLLPVPRAHYSGIQTLRLAEHSRSIQSPILIDSVDADDDASLWLYLINVRQVDYSMLLPHWLTSDSPFKIHVWLPNSNLVVTRSNTSQSCDEACSLYHSGYKCAALYFNQLNRCSTLKEYFPCERGCIGAVVGPDVPNYVVAKDKLEHHTCLTTESVSTCAAKHYSAQRLCPCLPSK